MEPASAPRSLPDRPLPLPAVVVNPSNVADLATLQAQITRVCAELGWAPPLWLPTTVEDPGGGQARAALAAGAEVVLACGGDGTVRHVAQVLAGSGTALGLLPTGTANLLARNLAIVLDNTAQATRIALSGNNRAIDVGRLIIDDRTEEQVFLVMAGMGFDAAIMAGAPHELKARLGSLAYVVSGVRALRGPRAPITLAVDGRPDPPLRVRTVVVGNCGRRLPSRPNSTAIRWVKCGRCECTSTGVPCWCASHLPADSDQHLRWRVTCDISRSVNSVAASASNCS
jgi:diacylglycerol kinase (ATP)